MHCGPEFVQQHERARRATKTVKIYGVSFPRRLFLFRFLRMLIVTLLVAVLVREMCQGHRRRNVFASRNATRRTGKKNRRWRQDSRVVSTIFGMCETTLARTDSNSLQHDSDDGSENLHFYTHVLFMFHCLGSKKVHNSRSGFVILGRCQTHSCSIMHTRAKARARA
jgi:hypothetical protein